MSNITEEHAARRFHHIERLERELTRMHADIALCKEHAKELRDRRDALIDRIRMAARDEGELPLFDAIDAEG